MTLTIASLHIYPVKSLGGFSVAEARTTDRGFEHDRRWMLVDGNGRFLSQRELPTMACLHCTPLADGFRVTDIRGGGALDLPWGITEGASVDATVWNDTVRVIATPEEATAWFTHRLGAPCTLVFMPDSTQRSVDPAYATGITSLGDGFPYLILSQASLDDLNGRIASAQPLTMDRFRPNIVIAGGSAYQEDGWQAITIGKTGFSLVKPCARCAIPTTDQNTGERGPEPLRTLAGFRRGTARNGSPGVFFGVNAMAEAGSVVRVFDTVHIV